MRAVLRDADTKNQLQPLSLTIGAAPSPTHFTKIFAGTDASQKRAKCACSGPPTDAACGQRDRAASKRAKQADLGSTNESVVRPYLLTTALNKCPISPAHLAMLDNPSEFFEGAPSDANCDGLAEDDPLIHLEQPKPVDSHMLHYCLDPEGGLRCFAPAKTAPTGAPAPALPQSNTDPPMAPAQLSCDKAAGPCLMHSAVLSRAATPDVLQSVLMPDLSTPTAFAHSIALMPPMALREHQTFRHDASPASFRVTTAPSPAFIGRVPTGRSKVSLPLWPKASSAIAKSNLATSHVQSRCAGATGGVNALCRRVSFTSGHRVHTPSPTHPSMPASAAISSLRIPSSYAVTRATLLLSTVKTPSSGLDSLHRINNMVNKQDRRSGQRHNRGRTAVSRASATLDHGGDSPKQIKAPTVVRVPVTTKPLQQPHGSAAAVEMGPADDSAAMSLSFSRATTPVCEIMEDTVQPRSSLELQANMNSSTCSLKMALQNVLSTKIPASALAPAAAPSLPTMGTSETVLAAICSARSPKPQLVGAAMGTPSLQNLLPTKNRTEVQVRRFGGVGERTLLSCNARSSQAGRGGRSGEQKLGGLSGGIVLKQATPTSARSLSLSGGSFTFTIRSST